MGVLELGVGDKRLGTHVQRQAFVDRQVDIGLVFILLDLDQVVVLVDVDVMGLQLVDISADGGAVHSEPSGDFRPSQPLGMAVQKQLKLCNAFSFHGNSFAWFGNHMQHILEKHVANCK